MPTPPKDLIPEPSLRTPRIFAFDPSLSSQFDTASIGEIEIKVQWEKDIGVRPVGEYVEVVDNRQEWKAFLERRTGNRLYFYYIVEI